MLFFFKQKAAYENPSGIGGAGMCINERHAQVQLFVEGPRDKVVTIVSVKNFRRCPLYPPDAADDLRRIDPCGCGSIAYTNLEHDYTA